MSSAEEIYELVKAMPEEDISKVLEFVKSLQQKSNSESSKKRKPLSDYLGLLKDSPTFKRMSEKTIKQVAEASIEYWQCR